VALEEEGMHRYETNVQDNVLYIEGESGWLEIGSMDDICALVGGETYTVTYDERQQTVGWLDTDADGTLSFNVRETIAEMDYDREFISNLETIDSDAIDADGYPLRAAVFAELMMNIWDSKGNLGEG
jgi:YD repeat-containing protein